MHPSSSLSPLSPLSPRDADRIARHVVHGDAARWLHPAQQALLYRRGWLRMLAPRAAGGGEMPLPDVVRLEEALARIDGSVAWTVTLCAGAGWFTGFLPPHLARDILATPRVCLAGSGAPTGHADREGDGWRIDGDWDYASGAPMATHFTFNAVLRDGGEVLLDADGRPRVLAFVVPARQVETIATWRGMGLRATATDAYRVRGEWVPADHGFEIDPARATAAGPLYRFPFLPFAYVTLAANVGGMAAHFVELAHAAVAQRRDRFGGGGPLIDAPGVRAQLDGARDRLAAVRARFYALLDAAWDRVAQGESVADADAGALQDVALAWVAAGRAAVNGLYPLCGLQAAFEDSAVNRVWRDFQTASQHALFVSCSTGQTATEPL